MDKKLQKLVRNTNSLTSPAAESVLHVNSRCLEKRNASSGLQIGQGSKQSATDGNQPIRVPKTKVAYEMMPGFRYNSKVLFCPQEQQFYLSNSPSVLGMGYTCYVDDCKCRMHFRNNECYVGNAIAHNHELKTQMYHDLCALNEIKWIIRSPDNELPMEQVFDDVVER